MHSFVHASNELLRKRGYRLTPQRHMILSVIQDANEHLSIEHILERVQKLNPYVSLSTIYRTLELLQSLGLIRESHLPGEPPRYEPAGSNTHLHLICRECRTTLHLPETLLGNLQETLQNTYHFHGLALEMMAAGYCAHCWEKIQQRRSETPEDNNPTTSPA